MSDLWEVEFKGGRRGFFLNPSKISFDVGDYVMVRADRGEDLGKVVQEDVSSTKRRSGRRRQEILRKAFLEEVESLKEKKSREAEAFLVCRQKIHERGLKMKLVDVEYQFDGSKIRFYFTADRRIDFRELVKDLAAIYRTRIELRQIGVREEVRRQGGYGPCGRGLCCATFLREFEPISAQMARDQHLSLSLTKISGVCGRLMCCLHFESDFYKQATKRFPRVGTKITSRRGRCEVCKADIFHSRVYLRYEDGTEERKSLEEVNRLMGSCERSPHKRKDEDETEDAEERST